MHRGAVWGVVLFILLISIPSVGEASDGTVEIRGIVRDLCGVPVAGVVVRGWDGAQVLNTRSDARGEYRLSGLKPGSVMALRWDNEGEMTRVDGVILPLKGALFISTEYGRIGVGGTLAVRLSSNPSTGYSWSLPEPDGKGVFACVGDLMEKRLDDGQDVRESAGRGGKHLWLFRALKKGSQTIVLRYQRSWEKVPPSRLAVVSVTAE